MDTLLALVFLASVLVLAYLYFSLRRDAITLQTQRDSLVQEKKVVFEFLHDLGEAFTGARDQTTDEKLLDIVVRYSVRSMGARAGAVFLLDESKTKLRAAVVEGFFPPPHPVDESVLSKVASRSHFLEQVIKAETLPVGEGVIGRVAQSGSPVLIADASNDPSVPQYKNEEWRIDTMLVAPLKMRDEILGVMALVNKTSPGPFQENELTVFTSLADQAALALYNAKYQSLQQEKTRMDRDLEIARDIQTLLLPMSPSAVKGFDIAAVNLPASHVGGDYYDFYPIDANRIGIGIADVSGKGVPGALMMVMCRSVARSKAAAYRTASAVLKEVNRLITPDMKQGMFITMEYAVVDSAKRALTVARAGHEPPLWLHSDTKQIEAITTQGMAVGFDSGRNFDLLIDEKTIQLQAGDVVVLYTDGITEAMNEQGIQFGREPFEEALRVASSGSSQEIVHNIGERIKRHMGSHPQHDDMTLVVLKAL